MRPGDIYDRGCCGRSKSVQVWIGYKLWRGDPMPAGTALSTTDWKVSSGRCGGHG
jgi:hypothetical protein